MSNFSPDIDIHHITPTIKQLDFPLSYSTSTPPPNYGEVIQNVIKLEALL